MANGIERRIANLEALASKVPSASSSRIDLRLLSTPELEEMKALRLKAGPDETWNLDRLDDAELCRLRELCSKALAPLAPDRNPLTR